jgi:hypothetical protein
MNTNPITKENKNKEQRIISTILTNNHYNLQCTQNGGKNPKQKKYGQPSHTMVMIRERLRNCLTQT